MRHLLASTSEVYGDPLIHPQSEAYQGNVNPIGPRSVYTEAKRYAEALTTAYHRHFGVNTGITRIFNTYGPRMRSDDGRVIPNFILCSLSGTPIVIYGDGSITRSFCYVSDLVEGIIRLTLTDHHEPVNLGNPVACTILDLAQQVRALTGSQSPIVFHPPVPDDPKLRQPDISRAQALLGWQPQIDLEQGLRLTVEAFRLADGACSG